MIGGYRGRVRLTKKIGRPNLNTREKPEVGTASGQAEMRTDREGDRREKEWEDEG